jgi:hypothetical protein
VLEGILIGYIFGGNIGWIKLRRFYRIWIELINPTDWEIDYLRRRVNGRRNSELEIEFAQHSYADNFDERVPEMS